MISVVIPLYNEELNMVENIHQIKEFLKKYDYELILIDDGSKDNTWNLIHDLNKEENRIKGIRFSRHFGKEIALCAGLDASSGDAVITMDSDLQHDPKYIDEFIAKWHEGNKIVEGIRENRNSNSAIYNFFAKIYYKILNRF